MDDPGGGSNAGGSPSGAVVVPIETAAPAAPPAAGARPAWTTRARARVTQAGAAARALVANAAARPARTRLTLRLAFAAALFLLGCAAAGLAFFAMILPAADDSRHLGKACAPPTDAAEAAYLRTASEYLLLAASAQVLAATMGLVVPAWPVAVFGWLLGSLTACRAAVVLWMLVASCNGSVYGALAFHFWLFYVVLLAAIFVGGFMPFIC